ncbi:CDP-diacylglycerol--glycerol-3-phosphate 3-phosphatidyltransferase [Rubidibacter lacunae KORDI 51-2]|uniref:CDP-diacylglycerol--glycerol-3-phosphate 3-phosphatidyltransferase n=1 Tax=Rubidibacter lacunae KORDI 51-2 TaxID=582515 RepID=U5DHP4_9CHRO|nr:CDP-diacylglycerol--glycerol-3-phosphate 3-phosphatidyltransferase [Rubidibacter lacunae]ERN41156.1 CDP-diacylglycerol--glycerol-3-phosphate 3-phosphatidyltransferase [Rubidibacter lacunae KORDI 51-2]
MTLATWVTLSRLLAIPLLFVWLQEPTAQSRWLALSVFLLAAGTDWLDGYIARRFDQITELGKFLDPLVDKLLVLAPLLICVQWQRIPAWAVFLLLARELIVAGWRVSPTMTAVPGANFWGKLKTVVQIAAVALLLAPAPPAWARVATVMFGASVILTLFSGAIYLVGTQSPADE